MSYLSVANLFLLLAPAENSSPSVRTGAYILVGVGSLTMLMGFLGCLGAVNEIRCLLGLVREFMLSFRSPFDTSPAKYLLDCILRFRSLWGQCFCQVNSDSILYLRTLYSLVSMLQPVVYLYKIFSVLNDTKLAS